jgi:hypothetical protein
MLNDAMMVVTTAMTIGILYDSERETAYEEAFHGIDESPDEYNSSIEWRSDDEGAEVDEENLESKDMTGRVGTHVCVFFPLGLQLLPKFHQMRISLRWKMIWQHSAIIRAVQGLRVEP